MREAMLTVGMLLLFAGALGAIGASTYNTGPSIADPNNTINTEILGVMPVINALFISEIVFTVIAFVGAAMVLRNR